MSDYKRFISYMYIYKKGLKGNNIGYAKIESRNGTCKFVVSVKYRELKEQEWNIALFYRGEDEESKKDINLINIDKVSCEKDELTVMYKTNEQNLFDSNIALNRIAGIILVGKNNEYIGTEWDDNGIEYKFINNEVQEYYKKDKVIENRIIDNKDDKKEDDKINSDKEIIIKEQVVKKDNSDAEKQEKGEYNSKINKTKTTENKETEYKEIDNNKMLTKENQLKIDNIMNEKSGYVEKSDIMNFNKFNESKISNQKKEQKIKAETQDNIKPYIKRILDGYPGMYPFEDDEVIDCIKLEPHDIGVFPMDKWPLANNSFLLHGYYTYRHLIFARLKRNNRIHYILGVPGIFRDREKFMAKMFGFNNFKGVRNKPLNTGEFGYWYMYLNV